MKINFQTKISKAGYTIEADILLIGMDLVCVITGGDHPHIGTVTEATMNMKNETYRFPSHDGRFHKDDILTEVILTKIKSFLPRNCVMIAGVHVDHISENQIKAAVEMAQKIGYDIAKWLSENDFAESKPIYY